MRGGFPIAVVLAVAVASCGHGSNATRAAACGNVQPGRYFPAGTFARPPTQYPAGLAVPERSADAGDADPTLDTFMQQWLGGRLCAMEEEPLALSGADEAYRLMWLRSFHDPVAVRIQSSAAHATLVAVELDGSDAKNPTEIRQRWERRLSEGDWARLRAAIEAAHFWDEQTVDPKPPGYDGSEWVLEGKRGGVYHVAERQSPEYNPFRAAGDALLAASWLSFPKDEVY
jgi:hypothetical protein